ncbi:MAG: hypothetical protein SFU85_12070 [Candidatus Methylacidiphilales bacterium]|nr:hypothetical protein [Candidatus Methylacidiphilales bacterium]
MKRKSLVELFRKGSGGRPRLGYPVDYAEKMLWRKILDRNPRFIVFCDKLATKAFIRERCSGLALPETLWIGTDSDQIPDALLAGDVFVKASHGWNFNQHIRHGKFDRPDLKMRTQRWLRSIHGQEMGEWA